jgi:hypothetical protein
MLKLEFEPALYQGTTSEAAEKVCFSGKMPEKHASGAKARVDSIGLMPGINPRPTARQEFFRSLFSRAADAAIMVRVLAPEGIYFQSLTFLGG